jgi:hypothetical protein
VTGPELSAALSDLGLSKYRFSVESGVEPSTVSKWCKPGASVPGYVVAIVALMRENRALRERAA